MYVYGLGEGPGAVVGVGLTKGAREGVCVGAWLRCRGLVKVPD